MDVLEELRWRGLLHQSSNDAELKAHLAGGQRTVYAGFDPTADSLTIGNLIPIMMLKHLQRAGHRPIVLAGGGTGLIGDPSGKSAERQLMTNETVEHHVSQQRRIFEGILDFEGPSAAVVMNNADWLTTMGYIEVLRDVGKHFSVNMMIQKESVKERLHNREQGISYTEFSYMILQAYDFLHLHREHGVTVQLGGSDQWGNIVAGIDLIRRDIASRYQGDVEEAAANLSAELHDKAFGLTAPLVTKADGGKFGKTESGAVWLSAPRTTPYAMYQFWLNANDDDVIRFLKLFTLNTKERIEELEAAHKANPGAREAHRALAYDATTLVHGEAEAESAANAARALFSGDVRSLPEHLVADVFADVPASEHAKSSLEGEGVDLVECLVETGLASSKRQAREFVQNGSVSINGDRAEEGRSLKTDDLLHGSVIAIRRGKKNWHLTKWA